MGYGAANTTRILAFPAFGLHTTLAQNHKIGAVFMIVSLTMSYALRRVFEALSMPTNQPEK